MRVIIIILALILSPLVLAEGYDVEAVKPAFLSIEDIPFTPMQGTPFEAIHWLPAGYYVVTGNLNTGSSGGQWMRAGQYLITQDGTFVGAQDIAYDARSAIPSSCGEGTGYQSSEVELVDDSSFIRIPQSDGISGSIFDLRPLTYDVSSSGAQLVRVASVPETSQCHTEYKLYDIAFADGRIIGIQDDTQGKRNIIMTPDYAVTDEFSQVATGGAHEGKEQPMIRPLFGMGDYFVAKTIKYSNTNPLNGNAFGHDRDIGGLGLYRFENDEPVLVHELLEPEDYMAPNGFIIGSYSSQPRTHLYLSHGIDAQDPSRVAIAIRTITGVEARIYSLVNGEMQLEETIALPTSFNSGVSLSGEHLGYVTFTGSSGEVHLFKGEQPLTIEPLPQGETELDGRPRDLEISADGNVLIVQRYQLSQYKIRDFEKGPSKVEIEFKKEILATTDGTWGTGAGDNHLKNAAPKGVYWQAGKFYITSAKCKIDNNDVPKGIWVFDEQGDEKTSANPCADAGRDRNWWHDSSLDPLYLEFTGNDSFYLWTETTDEVPGGFPYCYQEEDCTGKDNYAFMRAPIEYSYSDGQLNKVTDPQGPLDNHINEDWLMVGGELVGIKDESGTRRLAQYSLPQAELQWTGEQLSGAHNLLGSIEDLLVIRTLEGVAVYRNTGGEVAYLHDLDLYPYAARFKRDNGRIAFLEEDSIKVFIPGEDGLELQEDVAVTVTPLSSFDIEWDRIAVTSCEGVTSSTCQLALYEGGELIGEAKFPNNKGANVALSPNGQIVIGTRDYAYLYETSASEPPIDPENELTINAGGQGYYVYDTGHYLEEEQWKPFTFDTATFQGSKWIKGTATKTLKSIPEEGYVLAFICNKQQGKWNCGPQEADESEARRWTIRQYTLSGNNDGNECDQCSNIGTRRCSLGNTGGVSVGDSIETCQRVTDHNTGEACKRWVRSSCPTNYCSQNSCGTDDGSQNACRQEDNQVCNTGAVSNAQEVNRFCNHFGTGIQIDCFQCASGYIADWHEGKCVLEGNATSQCETNPGMKCVLYPEDNMQSTDKYCSFPSNSGTIFASEKGCYECEEGFVWEGDSCVLDDTQEQETSTQYTGGNGGVRWGERVASKEYEISCDVEQCVDSTNVCINQGENMIRPPGTYAEGTPHPRWLCSDSGSGAAFYYCSWQNQGKKLPGTDMYCCHTPEESPDYQFKTSC